jgi:quercetin dioxygenase-like cupin family protein
VFIRGSLFQNVTGYEKKNPIVSKIQLADEPVFEPIEGYRAKLIHTDSITIAHWTIDAHRELPEHAHTQEQIVNMMEGEFELTLDGTPIRLHPGDVLVIPGNMPHSGKAITDCKIIDVWHPRREDYMT